MKVFMLAAAAPLAWGCFTLPSVGGALPGRPLLRAQKPRRLEIRNDDGTEEMTGNLSLRLEARPALQGAPIEALCTSLPLALRTI